MSANPFPTLSRRSLPLASASEPELPPAIDWSEGMLLLPQHFQVLAARNEHLIHYHASTASPFHWGVMEYAANVSAKDGRFSVTALEAVMPDGLIVRRSGRDPELSKDLGALKREFLKGTPVATIYLAIAERDDYIAARERFLDGNIRLTGIDGPQREDVAVQRPALKLITSFETVNGRHVYFPLARVRFTDNAFRLEPFEPPQLRVARGVTPNGALFNLCRETAETLRFKAQALADQRMPTANAVPFLENRLMVHHLVGELPAFEALLDSEAAHPFDLYQALCRLVGHVAGLSKDLTPRELAPYDHDNLLATYQQAVDEIRRAVEEGVQEDYSELTFFGDRSEFRLPISESRLPIDDAWVNRELIVGVRVPPTASERDIDRWVAGSLIGSKSRVEDLRERRVTGVGRERLSEEASPMVAPRGVMLYRLTPGEQRQLLSAREDLVIRNPDDEKTEAKPIPRPEKIVLYVKKPV